MDLKARLSEVRVGPQGAFTKAFQPVNRGPYAAP